MKKAIILILLTSLYHSFAGNESIDNDIVIKAAVEQMNKFMSELKDQDVSPYFISYNIIEKKKHTITTSFGKAISAIDENTRTLDIDLRVGNYKLDNTHIIRGQPFMFGGGSISVQLPIEDDEIAIKSAIWYGTERVFKSAVERYEKVLTNKAVKVQEEDTSADLSFEKPQLFYDMPNKIVFDKSRWKMRVEELSGEFAKHPWILEAYSSFSYEESVRYLVNTEGTRVRTADNYSRVFISTSTKAEDGMNLPVYKSYFSFTPDGLESQAKMLEDANDLIRLLDDMRKAPIYEDTYSGPAILSGEASGVFFHEIFGHRVEGHRLKDPSDAQTFKNSVNTKVLPEFINVVFDPTKKELSGVPLSGYYKFDDQGVNSRKVIVAEKGIFKNFLMSRSPIEKFPNSNGHGRKQEGYAAVSRQSNLIVESVNTTSFNNLVNMLREEVKAQDKEYGLFFVKVQGGFTFTGRSIPNSFNVSPLVVYKVFADGRPNQLVRGVDLIGTPLTTFSEILATSDDFGVFNGICGAESGGVPVAACSPSILVKKIEVQKKAKSQAKPPILKSPSIIKVN